MPKQQLPKNAIKWNWSSTVAALKSLMRWKEPQFMKKKKHSANSVGGFYCQAGITFESSARGKR